ARFKDAPALVAALDALDELGPMSKTSLPAVGGEQQLLSVLMAMPPAGLPSTIASGDPTITLRLNKSDLHELEGHGARVEVLADGPLVAALVHTGSAATDQATRAAQCAMRIKARWPDARVALGTGSGLHHDRGTAGEVFDRAATLLRDHAGGPGSDRILIDE